MFLKWITQHLPLCLGLSRLDKEMELLDKIREKRYNR